MAITGATKVCGIIGDPVEHSLSPLMHNSAFRKLDLDYVYVPFRVDRRELRSAILGFKALNVRGINVTIPHKVSIMRYVDELDAEAKAIGSVNTIVNRGGKLKGFNTDGRAALEALRSARFSPEGQHVVMLGAGGAARAVSYFLVGRVATLKIFNRTLSNARRLARELNARFRTDAEAHPLSKKALKKAVTSAGILVNATPVGMRSHGGGLLIDPGWIKPGICVFDLVYSPVETALLAAAKRAGANAVNGVEMLARQGAMAFELWTGKAAPLDAMRQALIDALRP